MSMWQRAAALVFRLRGLFARRRLEREADQEIEMHLDLLTARYVRSGMAPAEARRSARARFGGVTQIRESLREQAGFPMIESIVHDVRYAMRGLFRAKGFAAVSVLTLALGLGVSATFFTIASGWALRSLPFDDPDALVVLSESRPRLGRTREFVSAGSFHDWRRDGHLFEGVAVYSQARFNVNFGRGRPERLQGARVSAELFPLLGIDPVRGRHFLPEEDRPAARRVALVSHGLWQRRFDADPGVLGRTIDLDDEPHEIIGVLPEDCRFPHFQDIWTPLRLDPTDEDRGRRRFEAIARLAPGVTAGRAQADLVARAEDLEARYPDTNEGWSIRARYLRDEWIPPVTRLAAAAQFVQVGFILLIVCANVANLMLARASARGYETVMKGALGATRGRLVRQSITEGIVLASLGGVLGIYMATWGDAWVKSLILVPTPYWVQFPFDGTALAFSLLAVVVTGVGISVLPALRGSRLDLTGMMKGAGGATGAAGGKLRRLLVVSQFALATILLASALLLARSYLTLDHAESGYATDGIVTMRVSLTGGAYQDPRQRLAYLDRAIERLQGARIVESAGAVSALPASREGFAPTVTFEVEGEVDGRGEARIATRHVVTSGYFETMEIPLLDGRPFTAAEVGEGRNVVILSDGLARRIWPDRARLGRQVRLAAGDAGQAPGPWLTVVGITRDVMPPAQVLGLDTVPAGQLYLPYGARPTRLMTLALRTRSDAVAAVAPLRAELQAVDETVPIYNVLTMSQVLDVVHWVPRLWSQTFSVFGALALLMSAMGVYAVTAYEVSRRRREIGVRMALGEPPGRILGFVLRDAGRSCVIGVAVGLAVAVPLAHLLARLLVDVHPNDVAVFGGVALLLVAVAACAAWVPAHRAARVDPMITLRAE